MKFVVSLSTLTCVALLSLSASANEGFAPTPTVSFTKSEIAGRNIDIIGVVPGMTVDEAKAALLETYAETDIRISEQTYRLGQDNVYVTSTPFAAAITYSDMFKRDADSFTATLTGVAGGNVVATVTRRARFPEAGGPTLETLQAALIEKYGVPSYAHGGGGGSPTIAVWQFKDGEVIPCPRWGDCAKAADRYDFSQNTDTPPEFDFVISAKIESRSLFNKDPEYMDITTTDLQIVHQAAVADFAAMKAEYERLAAVTAPIAAPKL